MKSKVIKIVACVMAAFYALDPAWAQFEEETTIEFAPDDEPLGVPPTSSVSSSKSSSEATAKGSQPSPASPVNKPSVGDLWGPPAPPKIKEEPSILSTKNGETEHKPGAKVFGRYRIRVGAGLPTFSDNLKFYKELYGNPSVYPVFGADWFAWDWYITFGISLKTGFYTAEGKPVKPVSGTTEISGENLEKDETSSTTLTLIPTQIALAAEFTPFPWKWLVVDGWYGVERLYFQEVRVGAQATSSQSMMPILAVASADEALTNNGWKSARTSGVAVNILLNFLDEQSTQSMRGSMGLASIYLSPYVEIVRQTSEGVDFSRVNRGITFTFETTY